MRISKLLMLAFVVGILTMTFMSCEKNEDVQPNRGIVIQTPESDRGYDDWEGEEYNYGGCEGEGRTGSGDGG